MTTKTKKILEILIFMVLFAGVCAIAWAMYVWPHLTVDEIIFHMSMPTGEIDNSLIISALYMIVIPTVIGVALFVLCINKLDTTLAYAKLRKKYRKSNKTFSRYEFLTLKPEMQNRITAVFLSIVIVVLCILSAVAWNNWKIGDYISNSTAYGEFIDENYVDPSKTNIAFNGQKRNLIYIYLESMEATYANEKDGGAFEKDLLPNLTKLAQENDCFSASNQVNGAIPLCNSYWTMGAIYAQTSGLPLTLTIGDNQMNQQDSFFPELTTLGNVLEKNGYTNYFLTGTDTSFAGCDKYLKEHGNYTIYDYNYSLKAGEIPAGYKVFWGYEDAKMFEFAKKHITEISKKSEPFNFSMITIDTHFEDGYLCSQCENPEEDNQYASVIRCSDRQVSAFIKWIQAQDFYKNTTIVVNGDHLTMDSDFCDNVSDDYVRKTYTCIINSSKTSGKNKDRIYSTMDLFPTTLSAIGATIKGDRLGMGTDLYSDTETYTEQMGVDEENRLLAQGSHFIDKLNEQIDINKQNKAELYYMDINGEEQILYVKESHPVNVDGKEVRFSSKLDLTKNGKKYFVTKDGGLSTRGTIPWTGAKKPIAIVVGWVVILFIFGKVRNKKR